MIINYRTVISFGQKNVDHINDRFESLLEGPMKEVIAKTNKVGHYYALGSSGRTLFVSLVFIVGVELLVATFEINAEDVFSSTYFLLFVFMSIGSQSANIPSISKAKAAARDVFAIIDEPSDLDIRKIRGDEI